MFISKTHKFAFSRTKGAADAAVEIALRNLFKGADVIATALPFYKMEALGDDALKLGPYATAVELKNALGGEYDIVVVDRHPLERVYSQFCWLKHIGNFREDFAAFIRSRKYDKRENSVDGAITLDFDNLSSEFSKFVAKFGVKLPKSFKLDENDGAAFMAAFDLAEVYTKEMLDLLGLPLPEVKKPAATVKPEAEEVVLEVGIEVTADMVTESAAIEPETAPEGSDAPDVAQESAAAKQPSKRKYRPSQE